MKITMYKLLGMIKDGKAPKRIKFENFIYIWRDTQKDYFCEQINHSLEDIIGGYLFNNLFLEVEILEEEKKIPEKIKDILRVDDLTHNDKIKLLDYITSLEEIIDGLKLKLETEHKAFMGTMQELTETATRIDKAMEKFEEAFDYREHKSVNIWNYPGERKEYIKMLESVYNELKGSEINEENNSI